MFGFYRQKRKMLNSTLGNAVYRIPKDLDKKNVFAELNYLFEYLSKEKKFVKQVFDTVSSLEKFYRASAQSLTKETESKLIVAKELPETTQFRVFLQIRLNEAARFLDIAQQIQRVLKDDFTTTKSTFDKNRKQLKTELKNLKAIIAEPFAVLDASSNGYEKYFKQLQQQSAKPEQIAKAINSLDEKLARVHQNYVTFHRKFVEYCDKREPLFARIEVLVRRANEILSELLQKVSKIDGIIVGDLMDSVDASKFTEKQSDQFEEEEESYEPSGTFFVKLTHTVKVGMTELMSGERFSVAEAKGDVWKLADITGKIWQIPQIYLEPDNPIVSSKK